MRQLLQVFAKMSKNQIAQRQLEQAELDLLHIEAHIEEMEAAKSVYIKRIARLEEYLAK